MPKKPQPASDPSTLHQVPESWHVAVRRLSATFELDDGEISEPYLFIVSLPGEGLILQVEALSTPPDEHTARELIFKAMTSPQRELRRKPIRPLEILFEDEKLYRSLIPALGKIGVATNLQQADPMLDEFIETLEETYSNLPEMFIPKGLLSVEGVTPKLVTALFEAAASYYRAAPWRSLEDTQTLKVRFDPPGREGFLQLMGQAGMEFGLVLYWNWEDVLQVLTPAEDPLEHIPSSGWHVLSFETRDMLPEEDQAAIRKYGWKTAGKKAYPLPMIAHADSFERPPREELIFFEALLRSLPSFANQHLKPDGSGDYLETEAAMTVKTADGPVEVTLAYPAGEVGGWFFDEEDEEGEIQFTLSSELERANFLMMKAHEEKAHARRIKLASEALEVSPDCTDACILLAEEQASSPEEALQWFEMGVQAGERALGKDFFAAREGDCWRAPAAHPYLRALQGVADVLANLGRDEQAVERYQELLSLNFDDHQGVRYPLLALLIKLGRDDEAEVLLDEYEGDEFAAWPYSRALLLFRREGDSTAARLELKAALAHNPFAPAYISGQKPLPEEPPEFSGFGDESEAIHYVSDHYPYWWATPGAVEWLKRNAM